MSHINIQLFNNKKAFFAIYIGALILTITPIIFSDLSIDPLFLISSFGILTFSILYYSYAFSKIGVKNFVISVFIFSLIIRVIAVFIYYLVFVKITGTPFDVTFADSLFYDRMGRELSDSVRNDSFSFLNFLNLHTHPDRIGYQTFLGFIYLFTNDSIIVARLIQALISAYTVIISYRLASIIWTEFHGRAVAILFSGFHPFILYSTLHLREFFLIFLTLLMTLYFIKLVQNNELKALYILVALLIVMLFFRTVYVVIFLSSILIYVILYKIRSFKSLFLSFGMIGIVLLVVSVTPIFDATWIKMLGYIGIEENVRLGGYSQELVLSRGMELAKYIGGPLFVVPSFPFPMPSLLKLSIEQFGQTMHWYFTGSLILWVFFSVFFFRGIYESIKRKNHLAVFLIILIVLHSAALIESFYFTSIRFNQVKMALLLFFVPSGMIYLKNRFGIYAIYLFGMAFVILTYNYLRIGGRAG